MENGGYGKAGFALFRRGRVVLGGEDQTYKPFRIFLQAQSPIAHKLFGELDLDDFPVNQAKDGFVWDDGLEETFIEELKDHIQDYINIAKMTNKERAREEEFSLEASESVHDKVNEFAEILSRYNENSRIEKENPFSIPRNTPSLEEDFENYLSSTNNLQEVSFGPLTASVPGDVEIYLRNHYPNLRPTLPESERENHMPERIVFSDGSIFEE